MDSKQLGNLTREIIIGSVLLVIILIGGTFFAGKGVSEDTRNAVRTVSLLYLDELAARSEQVVSSTLDDYISNMNVALGLMTRADLQSMETFQSYQARMRQLYGIDRFAFVDSDGVIYTSLGTRNDIALYNFDQNNMSGPEISIKNINSSNKKLIVAVPVDNIPVGGKTLVACFMEIDMEHMLSSVSLVANSSNTTFCNLFDSSGISLANVVLGNISSDENLFNVLSGADFEEGSELEFMRNDFTAGKRGIVSFTYKDIKYTLCYVPVRGTTWMLTYLIRESVITNLISSISDRIVFRNLIQSILTALVLVAMFVMVIIQTRKTAKLTLDREISETESRVKQQELEEQLALQEELLEQEKQRAQQDNMITALASDYRSVYHVNLDSDDCICYRKDPKAEDTLNEGERASYHELFTDYANTYVDENYRADFLKFIEPASIRSGLERAKIISYRYLTHRDGKEIYEMIRMAGVRHAEDRVDHMIHAVGVGFTNIDAEMRDSMSKSQALSDALKTAEEASRAKTVFLSSMSHEIRTPMNAIIGLDNLALHEPNVPDSVKDYLEKIGTSAQHLLSLINDILDMSRIESGRMIIKNEEFSFSKLIEQINTLFSSQCHEKELHYDCRITGHIDDYYIGDSIKLRQVLINILSNAVKFTPRGGNIDFLIEKTAGFDGKSTIQFIVRDTGIGMSKEYLPRIFDTFSQEDGTTTNKYGSSGLGMAITKNIVEMMNGRIEVESEKGRGTTFTVIVTLLDSDKKDSDAGADEEIRPQDMSVLVIDDDPIACEHAKLVLSKAGIVSDYVMSGKEAIEMVKMRHARRDPYNLIVVDWQMPEMDGLQATRQIRSIIGNESAIIILTAYNWDDIAEEAAEAGVDSFIAKPLFSSNLIEEFKSALRRKKAMTAAEVPTADLAGRRILLAEDIEVNAEIMMMVLSMREIEADHAVNGKVTVEMFERSAVGYYSAILMDIRMPEMDGLQATQAIRALPREDAKKIPIIALTANAFDEDVQRSLQAGLNAHLTKPIEPEVLFETLEKMIKP